MAKYSVWVQYIFRQANIRLHFNQHRFVPFVPFVRSVRNGAKGRRFTKPLLKPDVKRLIQLLPHDVWLSPDLHYKNDQTIPLIKSLRDRADERS